MKLREIFRYEIEYRLRSGSTWVYAVILYLVAIWMFLVTAELGGGMTELGGGLLATAPEQLIWAAARAGFFGILVTAALFGAAAVRDVQAAMDPLVFTSPLRKAEYIGAGFSVRWRLTPSSW